MTSIAKQASSKIMKCIQCATCSSSCSSGKRTALRTRMIIGMAIMGIRDVLSMDDIWFCTTCYNCSERCPRGIEIVTHKGRIGVELEPHRQFWKYVNRGWRFASETKIKLDKRNRKLIIYLTFVRDVEEYRTRGFIPVDVVSLWSLLIRARPGDGSGAPSLSGFSRWEPRSVGLDGRP